MQVLELGSYPTRVDRLEPLCRTGSNLWVKHDDATNPRYGGNKVRKLEYLLADASRVGARRIVTFGAAGSHHVLATTVHGVAAGFEVAALLTPLPFSEHARGNLRWALQAGLTAYACASLAALPFTLARTHRRRDYLVPPGGSSATGSAGYADAAVELARQVRDGELPEPDVIVVALGSGGTVAGLLAGLEETTLRCPVHAVRVVPWPMVSGAWVIALARSVGRRRGRRRWPAVVGRGWSWKRRTRRRLVPMRCDSWMPARMERSCTGTHFRVRVMKGSRGICRRRWSGCG
jgi:1-aminocyclopropane-1-carboxylate deaminase/D-cysteine desulfhydrase-like pyridoxal-dependent ACC family enzyme